LVLGFDAVRRRRRDVEEERGTKTRRVGTWEMEKKGGEACFGSDFYFLLF
jgi:hypothetical protein